jgi:hypothetical protein
METPMKIFGIAALAALAFAGLAPAPARAAALRGDGLAAPAVASDIVEARGRHWNRGRHYGWRRGHHYGWSHSRHRRMR